MTHRNLYDPMDPPAVFCGSSEVIEDHEQSCQTMIFSKASGKGC